MQHELIFVATITLVILVAMIIILFVIFQSKKNQYIIREMEAAQRMQQEISKSQMEIQEQTLKNIGWELHDNVGQLLSTAKLLLNMLQPNVPSQYHNELHNINTIIGDSLQEIRLLSRTLNMEVILKLGLVGSIECELERFNRMKFLRANLAISGDKIELDKKDEIIIFRILQEFFSNVIKHSKASELNVTLEYFREHLTIHAIDNGVGFDPKQDQSKGSGLVNMRSRAELIGAMLSVESRPECGVQLKLVYHFPKQ